VHDVGRGLAVDDSGCVLVTGYTESPDFPTRDPYQTYQGGSDVFITRLNSSGTALVYSTYFGGGSSDHGRAIALDGIGYARVTGFTRSSDFPTLDPYQDYQGAWDGFVVWITHKSCCGQYTGGYTGNTNFDVQGKYNLADITALISRVYVEPDTPLPCEPNGDLNCDGKMNLSDITQLICYVYVEPANCRPCLCDDLP